MEGLAQVMRRLETGGWYAKRAGSTLVVPFQEARSFLEVVCRLYSVA